MWASEPPRGGGGVSSKGPAAPRPRRMAHRVQQRRRGSKQIEDGTLILWLLHMDGYHELVDEITAQLCLVCGGWHGERGSERGP
jgi:hypothetical protein